MVICASCKAKVDDGAVRCLSCGGSLASPASFTQVSGWVLAALSSIPLGLGVVTEGENRYVLIVGGALLAIGIFLAFLGRFQARAEPPATLPDEESEEVD